MKQKKMLFILSSLCCSLMFCACGKKQQESQSKEVATTKYETKKKVQEVLQKAKSEDIKSNQNDFITFRDDFYVDVPTDVTEVSTFTLQKGEEYSGKEMKELFDRFLEKYFKGVYTKKEKKKLYQIVSADLDRKHTKQEGTFYSYFDHQKEIEEGNISVYAMGFGNRKGDIEIFSDGICNVIKGTVAQMDHQKNVGIYYPAEHHDNQEYIPVTYQFSGDQSYPLCDGKELKVNDAVQFVENHLNNDFPYLRSNSDLKVKVSNMKVLKIKDNVFDYSFGVVNSYHGVRFDCAYMKERESFVGTYGFSDKMIYAIDPMLVNVAKKDELDSVIGYSNNYDVKNEKRYDRIYSLNDAMGIIEKELSNKLKLECLSAEFIYSCGHEEEKGDSTQYVNPEWKITALNKIDHLLYYLYINAIDGSFIYATDHFEEDLK